MKQETMGWQWQQLDHGRMLFLMPNHHCQSTEGKMYKDTRAITLPLWAFWRQHITNAEVKSQDMTKVLTYQVFIYKVDEMLKFTCE